MPEILKNAVKCSTSYSYTDGSLVVSYKRKPMFKVAHNTRKEAFDYVKANEDRILITVAKVLNERGELPA